MKKKLSSSLTFLCKFGNPVFLAFVVVATIGPLISIEPLLSLIAVIVATLLLVVMHYTVMQFMVVEIDNENLYISNYFKDEVVPLENIRDVSEFVLSSPRLITVRFYDEIMFGKKIRFLGYSYIFLFFKSHPAAATIEGLKAAKLCRKE